MVGNQNATGSVGPRGGFVHVLDGGRRSAGDGQWSTLSGDRAVGDRGVGGLHVVMVGGTFGVFVGRNEALVPAAVFLQRVEDVLAIGVDEVDPRLPQRMHDVVDETNLTRKRGKPR